MRTANPLDFDALVSLDKEAYGADGAPNEYFLRKLTNFKEGVLVLENQGTIIGFAVFEKYQGNETPMGFSELNTKKLPKTWAFIAAFTTRSNYSNKDEDLVLLDSIENKAKSMNCQASFVPLSKNHPYEKHDVYDFWESNGYSKCEEISWISNSNEKIECFLLKKELV